MTSKRAGALALLVVATALMGFTTPGRAPAATTPQTAAQAAAAETVHVGEVGRGESLFWDGPYIESAGTATRTADPALCNSPVATYLSCIPTHEYSASANASAVAATVADVEGSLCGTEHQCFSYTFDVVTEGDELRVAFDQPTLRDKFGMLLYDPNDEFVALVGSPPGELRVEDPLPGRWRVRIEAFDVRDASVRLRAGLDPETTVRPGAHAPGQQRGTARGARGALLPNLQVVAPFELGFGTCQPTELVDYGARRCLRFSTGPANAGDGPLDLVVPEAGALEGEIFQRIHQADGSVETVPGGTFEWHQEHGHYHHDALQSLELLRVTDERRGHLAPAGTGPKLGFCIAPYFVADWSSFEQDPPYDIYGDDACQNYTGIVTPPVGTQMALARGWVDIYTWWVEGNFVDFGDNPDGLYVVRAGSDPDETITETDERDNTSYAYIRVTGDEVEVLERGIGDSPWDPRRTVVDDHRRPTRWDE